MRLGNPWKRVWAIPALIPASIFPGINPVSQWYVYPRTHIPSDMCIPPIWLLVKCVSPTPPPLQRSVGFISVVLVNFANHPHRQGDYKWFKIMSNITDKRVTTGDKIIAKLFLASLLLRGPQCRCNKTLVLVPLRIQRYYNYMSLVALIKYDWQNFIQQGKTRTVKK